MKTKLLVRISNVEFFKSVPSVVHIELANKQTNHRDDFQVEFNRSTKDLEFGKMSQNYPTMVYMSETELKACKTAFKRCKKLNFQDFEV